MMVDQPDVKVMVSQVLQEDGSKGKLNDEFVCKLCVSHVVGCKPMLTRCSHLFCGDCIKQYFEVQHGQENAVLCPVCKESLDEAKDLHLVGGDGEGGNKFLYRILSETRIVCGNNPKCNPSGNCNWIGSWGTYQDHIQHCKNLPLPRTAARQEHSTSKANKMPSCLEDAQCHVPEDHNSTESIYSASVHGDWRPPSSALSLSVHELFGILPELNTKDRVRAVSATDETCSTDTDDRCGSKLSAHAETFESEIYDPFEVEIFESSEKGSASPSHEHADEAQLASFGSSCASTTASFAPSTQTRHGKKKEAQWLQAMQLQQWQASQYQMAQYEALQWHNAQQQLAQAAQAVYAAQARAIRARQNLQRTRGNISTPARTK